MATRIIEYERGYRADVLPVVPQSTVRQTPITASGSNQVSAAFGVNTTMVCVQSDEAVHVARGPAPVATTSHYKVTAGNEQFFTVVPGEFIAILAGT